jgi:hypothetical protein
VAREILTLPVAAALMGREEPFLACLEAVLRKEGALISEVAAPVETGIAGAAGLEAGSGRAWTPVRERRIRPALFPAP